MTANILLPQTLEIGGGALQKLPQLLQAAGYHKPLLIADSIMQELGIVAKIGASLQANQFAFEASTALYTDVMPEPTEASLQPAVQQLKAGGFDCIIALGGGSAIDSAKAISVLAKYGGKMRDYKVPYELQNPGLPLIAIPTTAGTGSEVTRFTIITDDETDEKMLCVGKGLMPIAAIVDYELSLSLPARITADTGLDALTHAIEAYVSRKANPYSDQQALAALALLAPNIRTVYTEPNNHAAREAMMLGATLAGIAFSNASVALVHGMSRPLGVHFHVPHGLSNAMLLPLVTEYSLDSASDRYATCARAMGLANMTDTDTEANKALMDELAALNAYLGVPSLSAFGVPMQAYMGLIAQMVEQAIASGSPNNNPRIPSPSEMSQLYRRAYH